MWSNNDGMDPNWKPEPMAASEYKKELEEIRKKHQEIFEYCYPQRDKMWAAYVLGILLGCDYFDVDSHLNAIGGFKVR